MTIASKFAGILFN